MDKYDEILKGFETQRDEISLMSDKIRVLEKTNLFLIKLIEEKDKLPAMCDINAIRRYKELAVDKERLLSFVRDKSKIGTTNCKAMPSTLSQSYYRSKGANISASHSDTIQTICRPVSSFNDTTVVSFPKSESSTVFKSGDLKLRVSHLSPTRRHDLLQKNVLGRADDVGTSFSTDFNQLSGGNKDAIISSDISDDIKTLQDLSPPKQSDRYHIFPTFSFSKDSEKKPDPYINTASLDLPTNTHEDDKLKEALNNLITTLEERRSRIRNNEEPTIVEEQMNAVTADHVIFGKDNPVKNMDELRSFRVRSLFNEWGSKHSDKMMLPTSWQLQTELYQRTPEDNRKCISDDNCHLIQQNSSNSACHTLRDSIENINEETIHVVNQRFSEVRIRRQDELNRLYSNLKDKALLNRNEKIGFAKLTALIKGYIVRALLETDKVRGVITTIKETAHMVLTIRQEGTINGPTKSAFCLSDIHQPVIKQNDLLSQLRYALNELHEIFFVWPSYSRMSLLAIDQTIDESSDQGLAKERIANSKMSSPSFAAMRWPQKQTLRSNNVTDRINTVQKVTNPDYDQNISKLGLIVCSDTIRIKDPMVDAFNRAISRTRNITESGQQQQWTHPKTITTSICSQTSATDVYPYKNGFVTAMMERQNVVPDPICVVENYDEKIFVSEFPSESINFSNYCQTVEENTNNLGSRRSSFVVDNIQTTLKEKISLYNNACTDASSNKPLDNSSLNVDVDIGDLDYSCLYKNNSSISMKESDNDSRFGGDDMYNDSIVIVDVHQEFDERESNVNELRSTFDFSSCHCDDKPILSPSKTKSTKNKSKHTRNNPLPSQIVSDLYFSTNNVSSIRGHKFRRRLIAANSASSRQ